MKLIVFVVIVVQFLFLSRAWSRGAAAPSYLEEQPVELQNLIGSYLTVEDLNSLSRANNNMNQWHSNYSVIRPEWIEIANKRYSKIFQRLKNNPAWAHYLEHEMSLSDLLKDYQPQMIQFLRLSDLFSKYLKYYSQSYYQNLVDQYQIELVTPLRERIERIENHRNVSLDNYHCCDSISDLENSCIRRRGADCPPCCCYICPPATIGGTSAAVTSSLTSGFGAYAFFGGCCCGVTTVFFGSRYCTSRYQDQAESDWESLQSLRARLSQLTNLDARNQYLSRKIRKEVKRDIVNHPIWSGLKEEDKYAMIRNDYIYLYSLNDLVLKEVLSSTLGLILR